MTLKDELVKKSINGVEVNARNKEAEEKERLRVHKLALEDWLTTIKYLMSSSADHGHFSLEVLGDCKVDIGNEETLQYLLDFCTENDLTMTPVYSPPSLLDPRKNSPSCICVLISWEMMENKEMEPIEVELFEAMVER